MLRITSGALAGAGVGLLAWLFVANLPAVAAGLEADSPATAFRHSLAIGLGAMLIGGAVGGALARISRRRPANDEASAAVRRLDPWWTQKRWVAAGVSLWLLASPLYVASSGPVNYAYGRRWIYAQTYDRLIGPMRAVQNVGPLSLRQRWESYNRWWWYLGERQAASD